MGGMHYTNPSNDSALAEWNAVSSAINSALGRTDLKTYSSGETLCQYDVNNFSSHGYTGGGDASASCDDSPGVGVGGNAGGAFPGHNSNVSWKEISGSGSKENVNCKAEMFWKTDGSPNQIWARILKT